MIKLEAKNTALPKLKATQAELEDTQAELEASQAELEALQSKLEATQSKLEATQSRLKASQTELQTSQTEFAAWQAELQTTETELQTSQKQVVQLKKQLQKLTRLQAKDTIDLSNPSPAKETMRFPAWILLPMRIFLGLTFIYAGIQKLTDPQFFNPAMPEYIANQIKGMAHGSPLHNFLLDVALPHAVFFGWTTALGEIAIGLGTYAGFLFRPAAFFGMMLSLTFFLSASWNTYPYFFGSDIVFVFCWLTMILSGPLNTGLPSIDHWLVDQMLPGGHTRQKSPFVLQLYILLVVAGTPQKSSYTAGISLFRTNPLTRGSSPQGHQHKPSATQTAEMTRRGILKDWAVSAAAVASITLLGIPLRIFENDPNTSDNTASPISTTSTSSPTDTPSTVIPTSTPISPSSTNTPNAASHTNTSVAPSPTKTPIPAITPNTPGSALSPSITPLPVRPVAVGQSIAPVSAVPINSSVRFIIASSQDAAILIHLPNDTFVAYDAICTHAGCTVKYQQNTHILTCPCHGSQFDPIHNGRVLQGPAVAPLTPLSIHIDSTGAIKLKSVPS